MQAVIFWGQSGPQALICLLFVDYLLMFFTFCMFNFPAWVPESRSKDFHCKNMQQLQLLCYKYGYWIFHELGLDVRLFSLFFGIKEFQQFLNFSDRWSNIHFSYNHICTRSSEVSYIISEVPNGIKCKRWYCKNIE